MITFKKGDKVRVTDFYGNDSINSGVIGRSQSVYKDLGWSCFEYEIEGTVKLHNSQHCPDITHSYLLLLDGKEVGYVYNTALRLVPEKVFYATNLFNITTGVWSKVEDAVDEKLYKSIHFIDGSSYQITWNDNSRSIYKGYYK